MTYHVHNCICQELTHHIKSYRYTCAVDEQDQTASLTKMYINYLFLFGVECYRKSFCTRMRSGDSKNYSFVEFVVLGYIEATVMCVDKVVYECETSNKTLFPTPFRFNVQSDVQCTEEELRKRKKKILCTARALENAP